MKRLNTALRWLKDNGSDRDGRYYDRGKFSRMVKLNFILF
jgi:hypothetical protein